MELCGFSNHRIRNTAVIGLLLIAAIGVSFFSLFAKEHYSRGTRLLAYAEQERNRNFLYEAPIDLGEYTLLFEKGRLSISMEGALISQVYTDYDMPHICMERGMCVVYSYPSCTIYSVNGGNGEIRPLQLDTPVSAVRCAENGFIATLHDLDSVVCVYDSNGNPLLRIQRASAVFDVSLSPDGRRVTLVSLEPDSLDLYRCECFLIKNGKIKFSTILSSSEPVLCQAENTRVFIWSSDQSFVLSGSGKIYHLGKTT